MKTELAKKPREVDRIRALDPQHRKCRIHLQYANIEECLKCINFFKTLLNEKGKFLLLLVSILLIILCTGDPHYVPYTLLLIS